MYSNLYAENIYMQFLEKAVLTYKKKAWNKDTSARLPGSALKVPAWGGVGSYPLLSQARTPVEVELGCDNFLCSD
jgi:hypothetical protein